MALMSTCLARLGSRYSIILDPIRRQVHYGSLGLMCQRPAELVIALSDAKGTCALPLASKAGEDFFLVDQRLTMTSVIYEAQSPKQGVSLTVTLTAPFWPQDEPTSTVPAYLVRFDVRRLNRIRWTAADKDAPRAGKLRFALRVPEAKVRRVDGDLELGYEVVAGSRGFSGEGGAEARFKAPQRNADTFGQATDRIVGLEGDWRVAGDGLEVPYDVSGKTDLQSFTLAMVSHTDGAFFERFGEPMRLKYTRRWPDAAAVADFVRRRYKALLRKSAAFDGLWLDSDLPLSAQNLSALAFQSYLMCTLWTVGQGRGDWFSVWEGSCWYNSTVDVTLQESMFYFACWPELLEKIFAQWSHHANDVAAERERLGQTGHGGEPVADFAGKILQHDMGSGWTANGQDYHHAMPVEENANFLLMLYAHGQWWGRTELYEQYHALSVELVKYLLWADSTGNGFPDRGTANTIDDATPAVQYGRDNVYLGVKRLGALHAAASMFEALGDTPWANRCRKEVRTAVKTLNAGWLGDHWGVCLDKSAKGLVDAWNGKPLPYRTLPGWDAYSLYTTNGLLPLLMIDDLPPGLDAERLRQDVRNAWRASLTTYGCGHSSQDQRNMWVSMNLWRDCAGGYLGEDFLANADRYWAWQLASNGAGSEKPNCFAETSLTNNLVWYPRGAAAFGLPMSIAGLTIDRAAGRSNLTPAAPGRWPLLALADWKKGQVPVAVVQRKGQGFDVAIENPTPLTPDPKKRTR